MESHDDRTMGHLRPIKTKQLICIHAVASHVLHPKARPPKHARAARGIQAGDSQHSRSYAASTRSTDPGTSLSSFSPSSPIS